MIIAGNILMVIGGVFLLLGGFGVLRMPDVFNRIQAGTKATTRITSYNVCYTKLLRLLESAELATIEAMELYNMCLVAEEIFKAAIARKKSMGAHYREDDTDD